MKVKIYIATPAPVSVLKAKLEKSFENTGIKIDTKVIRGTGFEQVKVTTKTKLSGGLKVSYTMLESIVEKNVGDVLTSRTKITE